MATESLRPQPVAERSTILNVDDSEPGRYATTRMLAQAGFEVLEASTGEEAVGVARARGPDLIVLDMNLPDIDGLEVCARLRADPRTASIPVLHLTATYANGEHWAAALDRGANAYLTEPVEPAVLVATVRALLRARASEAEVRRAADRWQTTFDALPHALAYVDADGSILRCNRAMADLHRMSAEELMGAQATPPVPGGDAPPEGWPLARARESLRREVSEIRQGERWLEVAVDPVARGGVFQGAVCTVTDVTERRRLLERERAARMEAEAANRLKDEFLATLSHELRTPLNAIVGWAAVLRGQSLDPEMRRAVDTIDRNARAQSRLIEDILDVSRIVTGKLVLSMEAVDMVTAVGAALESLRPSAEARQIRVDVRLDPTLPPVAGDASRLQQVVWNLLSNSVKFTPAGGTVTVSADLRGAHVVLEVSDTGAGIAGDFLPHVFERFRQADASTTRAHSGLGLGLAIVRHVVELHGGSVEAESRGLGCGATFRVRLPAHRSERSARPAPPRAAAPSARPAVRLDGRRVLVVDDDADTLSLLATILRESGAQTSAAVSADAALESFLASPPDVLVTDIGLPGQDGFALLAAIRQLPAELGGEVPAIALTAYARPEDKQRALRSGFALHLAKPVDPAALLAAIAGVEPPAD